MASWIAFAGNFGISSLPRLVVLNRPEKRGRTFGIFSRFVRGRGRLLLSIAWCARPVSGYRALVPHRYVPAAFPLSRRWSDDRSPTANLSPRLSRRVSSRRRVFFSCHVDAASIMNRLRLCARRVRAARAASGAACASRARLATRLLRPRQSDPLPRHSPPRLRPPRFAPRKRAGESWYERTTLSPTQRSHG